MKISVAVQQKIILEINGEHEDTTLALTFSEAQELAEKLQAEVSKALSI